MEAYLDIETSFEGEITVIGVYRDDGVFTQLVGPAITPANLMACFQEVDRLYTFNGHRFDLPVIAQHLGVDLFQRCACQDLLYLCRRQGLRGGLKKVEEILGIPRATKGIDGHQAMELWEAYARKQSREALETLLLYNKEDVMNLVTLKERLQESGKA